jgi:predicted TIM-barrel fold metal-dependent hydrolase
VIIDAHAHPVFAGMPFHPGVHHLSQAYYSRKALEWTLPEFVNEMDRAGIDKVILLTACWKGQPARQRNEATAEILRHNPERFVGFGSFDPNTGGEAVTEIEYAIKGLGLAGVKAVAQNVEVFYNDPRCYPVYEKIQELGVPILFHSDIVSHRTILLTIKNQIRGPHDLGRRCPGLSRDENHPGPHGHAGIHGGSQLACATP